MHTKAARNIRVAFILNILFAIIELVGGLFTNSISIISNSIHDFGDALAIGISYLCERKARQRPNNKYTFGYLRFSLIGALITSMFLLVGSVIVLYNAIPRFFNPAIVDHDGMVVIAVFGVIINGLAVYKTVKASNINEEAINLHLLEDVFSWVVVLIGSLLMKFFNIPIIDPILSVIVTLYILLNVSRHLKKIIEIFLEKIPDDVNITELKKALKDNYKAIKEIHHIHVWTIDGVKNYMTMYLEVDNNVSKKELMNMKREIKEDLSKENIKHITIEIDYADEV